MSFDTAVRCCNENKRLLAQAYGDPINDVDAAVMWNLSQAVLNLASGLQDELAQIEAQMSALRSALQRRQ